VCVCVGGGCNVWACVCVFVCMGVFVTVCVCVCVGFVMCGCFGDCILYPDCGFSYPDVFLCFFLGCKANARVKLAKTGHGPHSSKLVVICVVLCIVCV